MERGTTCTKKPSLRVCLITCPQLWNKLSVVPVDVLVKISTSLYNLIPASRLSLFFEYFIMLGLQFPLSLPCPVLLISYFQTTDYKITIWSKRERYSTSQGPRTVSSDAFLQRGTFVSLQAQSAAPNISVSGSVPDPSSFSPVFLFAPFSLSKTGRLLDCPCTDSKTWRAVPTQLKLGEKAVGCRHERLLHLRWEDCDEQENQNG